MPIEFNRKFRRFQMESDRVPNIFIIHWAICFKRNYLWTILSAFHAISCCCFYTCLSRTSKQNFNSWKIILLNFVKDSKKLYGSEFLVYNVHNLLHITNDVNIFRPLDTFSAFPFENNLGHTKKLMKKGNQTLQQLVNRISEKIYVKF